MAEVSSQAGEIARSFANFFYHVVNFEPDKVHLLYTPQATRTHLRCHIPSPLAKPPSESWQMKGHYTQGPPEISQMIRTMSSSEGMTFRLEGVYAGGSTREGGVIVAVVGKVEARRGREGGEEKEEGGGRRGAGEGERGERVCNEEAGERGVCIEEFVEVFVLEEGVGGAYFVQSDMLHLLRHEEREREERREEGEEREEREVEARRPSA